MTLNHRRKRYTQNERIECVQAWQRSGMTRRKFALQINVCEKTFCRWVRDLKSSVTTQSTSVKLPEKLSLLPVAPSSPQQRIKIESHTGRQNMEVLMPSGIRLRFNAISEPRNLAVFIKELEQCS